MVISSRPGEPRIEHSRGSGQKTTQDYRRDVLSRSEDERLMREIALGDEAALSAFYDRYSRLVFSVCMRILRHSADAEEATIDIFWEIWKKPDRYDPARGSVVSYLLLLAKSRAIDRQRARQARGKLPLSHLSGGPESTWSNSAQASTPEPIEDLWLDERRSWIRASLDRLSPAQRQVVELAFFDGLSHRQIADRLKQPLGTIKTRIRQGIIQLRDGLRNVNREG